MIDWFSLARPFKAKSTGQLTLKDVQVITVKSTSILQRFSQSLYLTDENLLLDSDSVCPCKNPVSIHLSSLMKSLSKLARSYLFLCNAIHIMSIIIPDGEMVCSNSKFAFILTFISLAFSFRICFVLPFLLREYSLFSVNAAEIFLVCLSSLISLKKLKTFFFYVGSPNYMTNTEPLYSTKLNMFALDFKSINRSSQWYSVFEFQQCSIFYGKWIAKNIQMLNFIFYNLVWETL